MRNREINIIHMIGSILKYWWLILILGLAGASIAFINTSLTSTPIYRSTATIFIGKDDSISSRIGLTELRFNRNIIDDYRELIETRYLLSKAKDKLQLDLTLDELRQMVFVQSIEETRFMRIVAESEDPNLAARLSNAVSEELIESALDIVGIKNIQVVDYAKAGERPVRPVMARDVMVGFIFGVILAVYLLLLRYATYDRVYDKKMLEIHTGSEVIGDLTKKKKQEVLEYLVAHLRFMTRTGKTIVFVSHDNIYARASVVEEIAVKASKESLKVLLVDCIEKKVGASKYRLISQINTLYDQRIFSTNSTYLEVMPIKHDKYKNFETCIQVLENQYDVIMINADSLIKHAGILNYAHGFDHIINMSKHKQTKLDDINEIKDTLKRFDKKITANILYRGNI